MYQRSPRSSAVASPRSAPQPAGRWAYRTSPAAWAVAALLTMAFVAVAVAWQRGRLAHTDLRIVAHLVPVRYHPRLLQALHPLVHLGDAIAVVPITALAMMVLWLRGYRRCWAVWVGLLSWPIELGCKALLPQPVALDPTGSSPFYAETIDVGSLANGRGTAQVLGWLSHAAPDGLTALARQAGAASLTLASTFPSGTTARGAFVLGLLAWLCLALDVPVLSGLLALVLVPPLALLGLAVVLYAWHWPSDVFGGYLLGFTLLALSWAALRTPSGQGPAPQRPGPRSAVPVPREAVPTVPLPLRPTAQGPHSPRSPLPWVPNP